jgi:hypothetical protein
MAHPEIKEILLSLGFLCVKNKVCIESLARVMTLKSAAKLRKVNYLDLKECFESYGFLIEDKEKSE